MNAQNKIDTLVTNSGRVIYTEQAIIYEVCHFYYILLVTRATTLPVIKPTVMKV